MKKFEKLSREEMKAVLGGLRQASTCTLYCKEGNNDGISVTDCEVATAQSKCGTDISKSHCSCVTVTTD